VVRIGSLQHKEHVFSVSPACPATYLDVVEIEHEANCQVVENGHSIFFARFTKMANTIFLTTGTSP
jgi:hypothetical protein